MKLLIFMCLATSVLGIPNFKTDELKHLELIGLIRRASNYGRGNEKTILPPGITKDDAKKTTYPAAKLYIGNPNSGPVRPFGQFLINGEEIVI